MFRVLVPGDALVGGSGTRAPAVVAAGSVTFDSLGKVASVTPTAPSTGGGPAATLADVQYASPAWANGAAANTLTWDLVDANGNATLTAFAAPSATSSKTQNGSAPGMVDSIGITDDGSIVAKFGAGQAIPLQFAKVLQVFVIVLGPVLLGMWLRRKYPGLAERMAQPVKILSMLFLFAVVLIALVQEWETLKTWAPVVGLATLVFNLFSLAVGYVAPRAFGVSQRQATAIGMEIGIHNGTLAIAIALSPLLLNNATMAIPAAIYGLIAFITAAILVETVFAWPGVGRLVYESIVSRDFPVVQAIVLMTAGFVIITSLVVDILYAYLDPRIRYQ